MFYRSLHDDPEKNQQGKLYKLSGITCFPNFNEMSSTDRGWVQIPTPCFTSLRFQYLHCLEKNFHLSGLCILNLLWGAAKVFLSIRIQETSRAVVMRPCTEMLLEQISSD